jgi:hypothetical protein
VLTQEGPVVQQFVGFVQAMLNHAIIALLRLNCPSWRKLIGQIGGFK